jgi:hypothetical protein
MADHEDRKDSEQEPGTGEANTLLLGGLGIGAVGLISAAIGGAVCPVCIVAAPALLGVGAYKRWRAARARAAGAQPQGGGSKPLHRARLDALRDDGSDPVRVAAVDVSGAAK